MRHLRFWLTALYQHPDYTGLRGQMGVTGDDDVQLYDIIQENGVWYCLRWVYLETDPDAHAKKLLFTADNCFDCMAAAEKDAQRIYELMRATDERE